jgi:hypothetical protein
MAEGEFFQLADFVKHVTGGTLFATVVRNILRAAAVSVSRRSSILKEGEMRSVRSMVRNASIAGVLALVSVASHAAPILINTTPGTLTPTQSVALTYPVSQSVNAGDPFDFAFLFNVSPQVGGIFANVNWTPPGTTATATIYSADSSGTLIPGFSGMFTPTAGSNLSFSFSGILSGYYVIEVKGTAQAGGTNTLISGQVSPIPVPGTLAILGIGLLAVGLARARRV